MEKENLLFEDVLGTIIDGMEKGNRNTKIFLIAELLRSFDIKKEKALKFVEFLNSKTDEPLDQKEVKKAVNYIY